MEDLVPDMRLVLVAFCMIAYSRHEISMGCLVADSLFQA